MKKTLLVCLLSFTSSVMAASATISVSKMDGVDSSPSYKLTSLSIKENLSSTLAGDITFSGVQNQTTNGVGGRLELGLTATESFDLVKGYVRGAVGEYYLRNLSTSYYSIEPGISIPISPFSILFGFRYRNAFHESNTIQDQTRTWRTGLFYNLTKKDSIGIRYDRMRGDLNENIMSLNYTRNF